MQSSQDLASRPASSSASTPNNSSTMASTTATSSTSSPSSSPVLKIPLEILLRITWHLTTPQLGNLRLTSRHFQQSLDPTFIKEFFTLKQFMMSDFSLQALIDISKSRLGPYLKRIHFGLDRIPEHTHRTIDDPRQRNRLRKLLADQFTLWYTRSINDLLVEAFQNLPHLEDVVIRDFNSRRRGRDGLYAQWNSYGATTASQEIGIPLNQGSDNWNNDPVPYSSQVFAVILDSLARAGARPKGIEFMSRNRNHVRDIAFNITPRNEPSMTPLLKGLEKLHLDVDLAPRGLSYGIPNPTDTSMELDPRIRHFLLQCTGVKHLRINESNTMQLHIGMLLDWLGHDSNASAMSPPTLNQTLGVTPFEVPSPSLDHLEELNLGIMNVEASSILSVLRKFAPTLKRVELWKVTLQRNVPSDHTGAPPKVNFWVKLLEKMKGIPGLNLHHIKIGFPQQQWRQRTYKNHVQFRDTDSGGKVIEYTGPDWKHFIDDMLPKTNVMWMAQDDMGSESEEDEDDDDDSMADDDDGDDAEDDD